jgi:hypothetical protein
LYDILCFLATFIMGVEEAPSAPASLSMGVEEVAATPLQESMVCVVGVEELPPASVGVNIYASAPGRAEDLDFSSQTSTTSVRRWRNISGKKIAIGLVFVAILLAIGLTVALLSIPPSCCALPPLEDSDVGAPTETPAEAPTLAPMTFAPTPASVDPCIICPDGTDAAVFAPYADDGDSRTCADLIEWAKLYEIGSDECGNSELHELHCCYTAPENPCIICPNGATAGDDYVPEYEENSVTRGTCKDLIDGAKRFESESDACGLYDIDVAYCCPP